MQKATTSARFGRRSGGCYAFEKRAKPDAKSDDFGAVWTLSDPVAQLRAEAEKEEVEEKDEETITNEGDSNISEIVNRSGMSRSTVYKTLKKLSNEGIINLNQSEEDGRESLVTLVGNS